jgi:TPR repeat protein
MQRNVLGLIFSISVAVGLQPVLAQQSQKPQASKEAMRAFAKSLETAGFLRSQALLTLLEQIIRETAEREKFIGALREGDHAAAVKGLTPIAKAGDAVAQLYIGLVYDRGIGVEQNYAEAARWYQRAADQGVVSAQNNLGVKYVRGQGVERDPVRGYMWLSIAAHSENVAAKRNLGKLSGSLSQEQISTGESLARQWRLNRNNLP